MRSWHRGADSAVATGAERVETVEDAPAAPAVALPADADHGPTANPIHVSRAFTGRFALFSAPSAVDDADTVEWSVIFVAFLAYLFSIVTFKLPIGALSMVVALGGLAIQKHRVRFPTPVALLGLFVAWCAVGYTQSLYPAAVWVGLIDLLKVFLIALVAVNALRTPAQIRVFMIFYLACFALFPVRGTFYNYFAGITSYGRFHWNYFYANPNDLAALCLLQLSLAVGVVMTERNRWIRAGALAGCIVLPILIVLTQSRGTMLGLAVFGGLGWVGQRRRLRGLVILALIGATAAMAAPASVWERVQGLRNATNTTNLQSVDPEGSARQRWEIWRIARSIVRDNPIFGTGVGAYELTHHKYAQQSRFDPTGRGYRDVHSTYLKVIAETGIPGLLIFVALVGYTIAFSDRVRRRCRERLPSVAMQIYYLELGLIAFFVAGIFGSFGHLSYTHVQLVLLWAVAEMARRQVAMLEMTGAPPARAWSRSPAPGL